MGYNLTIGKRVLNSNYQEYYDDCIADGASPEEAEEQAECFKYTAQSESHDEAPAFGEPTDHSNDRWPSYGSWYNFCEAAGVTDLLYDGGTLKGGHPGYFHLSKDFVQKVNARYKMFSNRYPDAYPTYDDNHPNAGKMCSFSEMDQNGAKARFVWLNYWVQYAWKQYGTEAIIYNS